MGEARSKPEMRGGGGRDRRFGEQNTPDTRGKLKTRRRVAGIAPDKHAIPRTVVRTHRILSVWSATRKLTHYQLHPAWQKWRFTARFIGVFVLRVRSALRLYRRHTGC